MRNNKNTAQNVSALYELSLAIGKSLSVKESCRTFLVALMEKHCFSFCAVWANNNLSEREHSNAFGLIYGQPSEQIDKEELPLGHYIWTQLSNRDYIIINDSQTIFEECIHEKNISGGYYVCYRLEEFGYLKLYASGEEQFSEDRAKQMIGLINRFAFHLKGCFAHELLIHETDARKTAQRALNISEEKHKTVVRNLSEGIVITDLKGEITFANEQMTVLSGYSNGELIGSRAYELLAESEEAKEAVRRIGKRKEGESEEYVVEHTNKNGRQWMGRIKASPYTNIKGEIIGTMGIVSDITAQIEAEQKIVESEQKFRKVIDTSLDAVVAIDEKGYVTEWNQQAEVIFDYQREEAIGKLMSTLIIPTQYRKSHDEGMERFLATGEGPVLNSRIEITALDKSGREFPIELSISSIKIKGQYTFSAFMRDITDRKRAEEELIAAKQTAEQAHKAEQQFLANMSHEIRTPMNAVIGMTHLLYETEPSKVQEEYLDSLRFSADSLMGIISNILDLSKIEAGEMEFEKRTFNLVELLSALRQTFQFKVREKPVSVDVDIDPGIEHYLIGDSVRLNQILTNLLGNASKFTQRGTIGVRARIVARPASQCIIQFQVHDTGIGIDTDRIGMIFKNFKQAEIGITRKFGGTGLGLAIVKQLVELQGGTIEVESEKKKGSTFTVTMPFDYSSLKMSELPLEEDVEDDNDEIIKAIDILVVEDNPMNQKLVSKILDLWECHYEIAPSGIAALEITAQKQFDIILMDIHMPEMDGCEATIQIRNTIENPNQSCPIIALTAAALLDEKNRALESGMNDFLTKPFSPSQLKQIIVKWGGGKTDRQKQIGGCPAQVEPAEAIEIDLDYLKSISQDDNRFVCEMIHIFINEIPLALKSIQEAYENQNWLDVCNTAHRIKSNYMMVGMKEQQQLALKIEKSIKEEKYSAEELKSWVEQLKGASEQAYPQLEKELRALSPITVCPVTGAKVG